MHWFSWGRGKAWWEFKKCCAWLAITSVAVPCLLCIVETQTQKRVPSAIKVNELNKHGNPERWGSGRIWGYFPCLGVKKALKFQAWFCSSAYKRSPLFSQIIPFKQLEVSLTSKQAVCVMNSALSKYRQHVFILHQILGIFTGYTLKHSCIML